MIHVNAEFGKDLFRGALADTRNLVDQLNGGSKPARGPGLNLLVQGRDLGVYKVDLAEQGGEHEALVRLHAASQRLSQFLSLVAEPTSGQLSQLLSVIGSTHQLIQNRPTRSPQHVGGDRAQL